MFGHGLLELELALLDELHRRHGGDRLGHRGDAEDGVERHRRALVERAQAERALRRAGPCRSRPSPRRPALPWRRRPAAGRRRSAPWRSPERSPGEHWWSRPMRQPRWPRLPSIRRDGCAVSVSCAVPPWWTGRITSSALSAIHFWIIWAIWSEFLSIISMWPLPVTPSSGSSHQSATPPAARSASRIALRRRDEARPERALRDVVAPDDEVRHALEHAAGGRLGLGRARRLDRDQRLHLVGRGERRVEAEVAALAVHDDHAGADLLHELVVGGLDLRVGRRPARHALLDELIERVGREELARQGDPFRRVELVAADRRRCESPPRPASWCGTAARS